MPDSKPKHAEGELKIVGESAACHGHGDYGREILLGTGPDRLHATLLFKACDLYGDVEGQLANANRLCLCWNFHERLVDMLRRATNWSDPLSQDFRREPEQSWSADAERLLSDITKAEQSTGEAGQAE